MERRLEKNTWNFFQYYALLEAFRTCSIFLYSSKACKTSFEFFLKKLALFKKKDVFGAVERRLKKKHLKNVKVLWEQSLFLMPQEKAS